MSSRSEVHSMWARVALVLGVGAVLALAGSKAEDVGAAMIITAFLLFLLW